MPDPAPPPPRPPCRRGFPAWVPLGGLVLALIYLPTLWTPFDFIDDGNLVYPAPAGTTLVGHAERYADKVAANVTHLGPFRPVLWAHWELFANTFAGDAAWWRAERLAWCGLAATALLALLHALNVPRWPALLSAAAAMANPYRNEIWTSLTLAEGVAMPYALLALWAARRATQAGRPLRFDLVALAALTAALGCKNVFVALVPAMVALRVLADGMAARESWRANRLRAAAYLLPVLLPAAHFAYFKTHWHPGQYETPGPSVAQLGRMLSWLKGAAGLDFLGVGLAVVLLGLGARRAKLAWPAWLAEYRALLVAGGLLIASGVAVYLPMPMMAARYTMPAVWGVDLLTAFALTAFFALPRGPLVRVGTAAVVAGLAVMVGVNAARQEKFAARANLLWDAVRHVEEQAPHGSRIAWESGPSNATQLNAEEGIHFRWHLLHRGRGDLQVGLFTETGEPIERVELPPLEGSPHYRLAMGRPTTEAGVEFAAAYRLGRVRLACRLEPVPRPVELPSPSEEELLNRLTRRGAGGGPATAAVRPGRAAGE